MPLIDAHTFSVDTIAVVGRHVSWALTGVMGNVAAMLRVALIC